MDYDFLRAILKLLGCRGSSFKRRMLTLLLGIHPYSFPGYFSQWIGVNVDHNVITLDSKGSFDGMGIISVSTPTNIGELAAFNNKHLKRLKYCKNEDLSHHSIPIVNTPKLSFYEGLISSVGSVQTN